jgi:ankyrin repeat protein
MGRSFILSSMERGLGIGLLGRRLRVGLLLAGIVAATSFDAVRAQTTAESVALTNDVRVARSQLKWRRPPLAVAELDRLAQLLGRSNYVLSTLPQALIRKEATNVAHLLDVYPGKIDDLRPFGEPMPVFAARYGDLPTLNLLIERKANLNLRGQSTGSALEAAVQNGQWESASRLIDAGVDVYGTNAHGQTPLGLVVERWWGWQRELPGTNSRSDLLDKILSRGADPFAPVDENSPISIVERAWERRHGNLGDLLLTNSPSPSRRTPSGDTALHLAVKWNQTNDVDFLLASDFSIDQTNNDGLTPLQELVGSAQGGAFGSSFASPAMIPITPGGQSQVFVLQFGTFRTSGPVPMAMADYLLAHGAMLDVWSAAGLGRTNELTALLATNKSLANARDGLGRTPLHYAVFEVPVVVNYFGPSNPTATNKQRSVALAESSTPQFKAAQILISAGADPSVPTTRPFARAHDRSVIPVGSTPLHLASFHSEAAMINLLLKAGASARQTNADGDTPLHLAAADGSSNTLAVLVSAHAPLDAMNQDHKTPVRIAVEAASAPSVEFLLNAGANPQIGLVSNTLLHLAAERSSADVVKLLLQHGLILEAPDGKGNTPFMKSIHARQWETANLFWKKGANINATNGSGNTALHELAADARDDDAGHMNEQSWYDKFGESWLSKPGLRLSTMTNLLHWGLLPAPAPAIWTNTSMIAWLVAHKANLNLTNRQGETPLQLLLGQDWMVFDLPRATNRIADLLAAGARIDIPDRDGMSSLHLATRIPSPQILTMLTKRAGKLDNFRDGAGRTPMHYAAMGPLREDRGYNGTNIAVLLALGASAKVRDNQGLTPLHLAVTNRFDGRLEATRLLLQHGADPNARDSQGRTPLHLLAQAIQSGDYFAKASETLHLLLDSGADGSLRDNEGQTFLHRWCEQGHAQSGNLDQILRELVPQHPNLVNVTNAAGDTLLHVAVRADDTSATQLLMQSGADPLIRNRNGESALYLAEENDGGGIANVVHPKTIQGGVNFHWSIATRNKKDFDSWLDAEPVLAQITFKNGETALMVATQGGVPKTFAKRLLEMGAPLDPISALRMGRFDDARRLIRESTNCPANLWFEAIRLKRFDKIQDLIGTHGNVSALDGEDHTLLFYAATSEQTNLADWFRAQGVTETLVDAVAMGDTNTLASMLATNRDLANSHRAGGDTVLMLAARTRQSKSARWLIVHGADIHAVNASGWDALYLACAFGATNVTEELLAAGADPNGPPSVELPPLHFCAANGQADMATILLNHGAKLDLAQASQSEIYRSMPAGATPLHWAANWGRLELVRLLLKRGANVRATNVVGETPIDLVRKSPSVQSYQLWVPGLPYRAPARDGDKVWGEIETALAEAGGTPVNRQP